MNVSRFAGCLQLAAISAICFAAPAALAGSVELLITDRDDDAVYRFDGETGDFIDVFIPSGSGGLDRPVGITIGPDEHLYISNFGPGEILKFDGETGDYLGAFYDDTYWLEEPVDVLFDGEYAYLLGNDTENVVVVDADTGNFIDSVGNNTIRYPHDMEIGPDRYVYIATENNSQGLIQVWDIRNDMMIEHFAPPGELGLATGITFRPDGDILVSDWWDGEVVRYDAETHDFVDFFIPANSGGISGPGKLEYGPGGDLYVGNSNGVHRFDGETGEFIDVLVATGDGGLSNPRGFVFRYLGSPADVNNDGVVDIDDLFAVLAAWGPCTDCPEDVNDDGVVDIDDVFEVLANWGPAK